MRMSCGLSKVKIYAEVFAGLKKETQHHLLSFFFYWDIPLVEVKLSLIMKTNQRVQLNSA